MLTPRLIVLSTFTALSQDQSSLTSLLCLNWKWYVSPAWIVNTAQFYMVLPPYFLISLLVRQWPQSHRKLIRGLLILKCSEMSITPIPTPLSSTPLSPLPGQLQNKQESFCPVAALLVLGLPSHSWLKYILTACPFFCTTIMHPFGCDIGGPHTLPSPALRWLWGWENDVQLGCLSPCWKMEGWHHYRSRWHCTLGVIFSDKLGLGLRILAFACYSYSHQNITMKIR